MFFRFAPISNLENVSTVAGTGQKLSTVPVPVKRVPVNFSTGRSLPCRAQLYRVRAGLGPA